MSVREMTVTTMTWVKEFSTNTFLRAGQRLFEIEFIDRNKKRIALGLLIWLMGILGGYLVYRGAVGGIRNDFYQRGFSAVEKLASTTGASLLEKDMLSLNVAIGDVSGTEGLIFAAIVDHEDKIVAHTDSSLINRPFIPPAKVRYLDTSEVVSIEEGIASNNKEIIGFSLDVAYAGMKIGKAYFALSASPLYKSLNNCKWLLIFWVVSGALLLSATLVGIDRVSMARAHKRQKELEGITQMGPYMLREKIAQGGMAEVFLADYVREDGFRRIVAVKRVLPHLAMSPKFINMFIREARLAAQLQHPNVVQISDFGKIHDAYFIAMEYVRGKSLAEILAMSRGALSVEQAIFIVSQICMGLVYSHSKKDDTSGEPLNIVHRDISPENILVSIEGEVKISDFGISKASSEPSLTQAGVIRGKFSYMPPELALGETVDHQADIFSLGIVFYEMLSGKRLYQFSTDIEAIRSIPEQEIVPIKDVRPDITDELNNTVMKCLEKDRKLRYQRAQELLDDLVHLKQSLGSTYDRSNLASLMKQHFSDDKKVSDK